MITIKRGDVLLADFIYTNEAGTKQRPMYVISSDEYNSSRGEVVAGAITSNISRQLIGDHLIGDWKGAGLMRPSTALATLRTVDKDLIRKRIGRLSATDLKAIESNLRAVLGL
jgi:mRNA interferase MazF